MTILPGMSIVWHRLSAIAPAGGVIPIGVIDSRDGAHRDVLDVFGRKVNLHHRNLIIEVWCEVPQEAGRRYSQTKFCFQVFGTSDDYIALTDGGLLVKPDDIKWHDASDQMCFVANKFPIGSAKTLEAVIVALFMRRK